MYCKYSLIALAVIALTVPVWADSNEAGETTTHEDSNSDSDIGWNGWGLRIGLADDPDQVVGGVHFNLGEFIPNLRFQPDVQLGLGDDHTTLYGTAPVYYYFGTETRFTPYAGGGLTLGFVDRDLPAGSNADDTSFEVGVKATGGLEWSKKNGRAFFLELSLGIGDVHDATILAAWSF